MSFFKTSDSNFQNKVVEVMSDDQLCEKCKSKLNLLNSKDGKVACNKCGHENTLGCIN